MLRRLITLALLFIAPLFSLKAQLAVSAEALVAYPLYFEQEDLGITTQHLQKGFRATGYYYSNFDDDMSIMAVMRFTHHFATTDSATAQAYGQWSTERIPLSGSVKTVFNSFVPQFGVNFKSYNFPLVSYRFSFGMGASWARAIYEFPAFDSLTMHYMNPPWNTTGKYNDVGKLVAIRPCMVLNFAVQYEFKYFFAFGNFDLSYSMGDFPPTPVSIGAGILVPIFRKD